MENLFTLLLVKIFLTFEKNDLTEKIRAKLSLYARVTVRVKSERL